MSCHRPGRMLQAISTLVVLIVFAALTATSGAATQTCSEFPNQAAAQRAADTRDGNGNGIYCESLPCPCSTSRAGGTRNSGEGTGGSGSCVLPAGVQNIPFSSAKYPNIRANVLRAERDGWPSILVLNRPGAGARRDRALQDIPTRPGDDRDEYPPAEARGVGPGLTKGLNPTGWMTNVAYVPSHENRSQGATMEDELRRFCNGTRFRYVFD
jgi:hypothetical protein